ncbi:MAG: RNA polymerase factor sigma-54 [Bryobacteraceae bacterium]
MSLLSPKLQLKVAQKQILTPSLMQMVAVLQLNRLELKDLIQQEIAQNPVLEEATEDGAEELSPEELQALLEAEEERTEPSDKAVLEATETTEQAAQEAFSESEEPGQAGAEETEGAAVVEPAQPDPFEEIDFGSFFEEYLDPGYRAPASETVERPSLESYLSQPVTLADHLRAQLSMMPLEDAVHDAADSIIGNLDENGYLTGTLEEIAASGEHKLEHVEQALRVVQSLDPAGVGARDVRECLLLQLKSRNGEGGVAWQIVSDHLGLLEKHHVRELAKALRRPVEHIEIALRVIRSLDPRPGLRYSGPGARQIEPDVYIFKEGDEYIVQLNDDDLPQLRLNSQYRRLLERGQESDRQVRNYIKERFTSALQLMKNIEQRKQTILRVCEAIVRRQREFLDHGLDRLRPMMIKDVAEEIGVHPSTVSRAVANKYAHTPQGVFELRYFFSEPVQGPSGAAIPLLTLKRMVKKMIEEEDPAHPLTDEQIAALLKAKGIYVTRRTVAKYREDMKIPSTHQRRRRD